jgi:hypothetical protein
MFVAIALAFGSAARADGADRKDQLFATWQEAQRSTTTLVVEFTLKTWDPTFSKRHQFEGTFRLIRSPKGEVLASYEVALAKAKGDVPERSSGLLSNGKVYLLNHDKKTAIRFEPSDGDLQRFVEKYFNPFVLLLDRKRADEQCLVDVAKQDEQFTYLTVKPKAVKPSGWFTDQFHEGRAILMNKASDMVPKDMPRQLWYTDGRQEYTYEIKSWRHDPAEPPKLEEFVRPEDRPGWEVREWPMRKRM